MKPVFSSGDPVVDRRLDWARALLAGGHAQDACVLLHEAVQTRPTWTAGWTELGRIALEAQDYDLALQALNTALSLDPLDHFGAGVYLDRLRQVPLRQNLPIAFVETLFDQMAPSFDQHLTGKLSYQGPELLRDAILRRGRSRFSHAIDLGCGTGLSGQVLRPFSDRLTGVDVSSEMLQRARAKGLYDDLHQADINQMALQPNCFDLIFASDVFNYLGALDRIIGWSAHSMQPGGILAFFVEKGDAPMVLCETNRFTHSVDYIETILAQAGFEQVGIDEAETRQDRGRGVASLIVTAQAAVVRPKQSDGEENAAFA